MFNFKIVLESKKQKHRQISKAQFNHRPTCLFASHFPFCDGSCGGYNNLKDCVDLSLPIIITLFVTIISRRAADAKRFSRSISYLNFCVRRDRMSGMQANLGDLAIRFQRGRPARREKNSPATGNSILLSGQMSRMEKIPVHKYFRVA